MRGSTPAVAQPDPPLPAGTIIEAMPHDDPGAGLRPGMRGVSLLALLPDGQRRSVLILVVHEGAVMNLRADCDRLTRHEPVEQARLLFEFKRLPTYLGNAIPEPAAAIGITSATR